MYTKSSSFDDRPTQDFYNSVIIENTNQLLLKNHSHVTNNMHQLRQARDAFNSNPVNSLNQTVANQRSKNSLDKSSTDFYTNLTNNHVNSYLNNLNFDFNQQHSSFNQTSSLNHFSLNQSSLKTSSSSSSLSSTSSLNSKKFNYVQDNLKLNSNLANFVSESQLSTNKNLPFQQVNCSLIWSNVNYKVKCNELNFNLRKPFNLMKEKEKLILNNVSGHVNSAELIALIGPSGVGKSSLLEILAGRRVKGTSGKVNINLQHLKFQSGILNSKKHEEEFKNQESNWNKIAFIPQKDYHLSWLTVYETLIYASKIKNCKLAKKIISKQLKLKSNLELYLKQNCLNSSLKPLGGHLTKDQINQSSFNSQTSQLFNDQFNSTLQTEEEYHQTIVINILKDLSLETCMHNLVRNCSGGQLRRLSIALELLNQPKLILIDEPTTGLDFSSALKCIQTLRCLTMMNKPPGKFKIIRSA